MNDWLKTYGWKFLLAIIVAVIAFLYIVHLERKADGLALVKPVPNSVVVELLAV